MEKKVIGFMKQSLVPSHIKLLDGKLFTDESANDVFVDDTYGFTYRLRFYGLEVSLRNAEYVADANKVYECVVSCEDDPSTFASFVDKDVVYNIIGYDDEPLQLYVETHNGKLLCNTTLNEGIRFECLTDSNGDFTVISESSYI